MAASQTAAQQQQQQQQQEKLAALTQSFHKLQSELSDLITSRQRLDSQRSETRSVASEFAHLSPTDRVFKLVGPALLLQEHGEATQNVAKRIELIEGDLKRTDELIAANEAKSGALRQQIVGIQTQLAAAANANAAAATGAAATAQPALAVQQ